ncbi:MAG: DUF6268 family outer membrane beta-barrel protein [Crocinitomicaceae bacterium]
MKLIFLILAIAFSTSGFCQKFIDLGNVYWRTSPGNSVDSLDLKRNLNTYVADAKLPIVLNDKNVAIVGMEYQQNDLSFADDDWKDILDYQFASSTLQLGLEHKWNDRSKMLFMSMGRLNTDYNNVNSSHFQIGGLFLGTTNRSENFAWKYGCYYNGEFFGPMIVPLFGFDWKINEKWRLKTVIPVDLELSYQPSDGLRTGLRFDGVNGSYRAALIDWKTDTHIDKADNNIWLFGEKKLGKYLWIHGKAGHSILRKYRFYDNNEKLGLKIGPVNLLDERPETISMLENGWSFELRLIFRMPLD